ncbi:MAG: hypothetical protein AUI57_07720 [Candidatus Rokubacteria bacterium 13_1_40CM_2_68_8]|nr:MAG: hypothetical protein AUI57_07720 [Candidatus Rokubacteria bacterium 13_1_40CM_2_68_8]
MRTVRRTAAVLILPAIAYLGAACERTAPTASVPVRGLEADLVAQTASYLTQRLLALEALIPDGTLTPDDPLPFGHTIHVVTHDNQDSWKVQVSPTEVTFADELTCDADQAPPLPPGALHLVVMPDANAVFTFARLRSTRYHRTYLRDLSRLDYYACDERNNGQQWPFIALEIDWDGNNTIDDELIFEPTYQNPVDGGLCGVGSNQGPPVLPMWRFWDALRNDGGTFMACWWSMNDPLFPPGDVIRPLSEYITAHPNAAIVNLDGNHGGIQIMHGFSDPNDTYNGWVDAFTIGKDINGSNGQTQNSTITYDFQKP